MKIHEQLRVNGWIRVVDDTGPERDTARRKQFELRRISSESYLAAVETRTRKVRASRIITRAELESLLAAFTSDEVYIDWHAGANTLRPWTFERGIRTSIGGGESHVTALDVPTAQGRGVLIRVMAHDDQWNALTENIKEELR